MDVQTAPPMSASVAVRYARLLRPFPTKRLGDELYRVQADAAALRDELFRTLTDPPTVPEQWCQRLQALTGLLASLEEEARATRDVLREMYDDADRAFEVAVRACESLMRGLAVTDDA